MCVNFYIYVYVWVCVCMRVYIYVSVHMCVVICVSMSALVFSSRKITGNMHFQFSKENSNDSSVFYVSV